MCGGIAIHWKGVSQELADRYGLLPTSVGTEERMIRFQYRDPIPLLPAYEKGELGIYLWGNRNDQESKLPHTGWCKVESLHAGKWNFLHPEPVDIPAAMGLEKGVWFPIDTGMRGILVSDENAEKHVFMLTQPADSAYLALTKHERMPVFL
jgi:hypothetical protein